MGAERASGSPVGGDDYPRNAVGASQKRDRAQAVVRSTRVGISCGITLVAALAGCGGSAPTTTTAPPDPATAKQLRAAYATLRQEAADQPPARFRRLDRRLRRHAPSYYTTTDYLVVVRYFSRADRAGTPSISPLRAGQTTAAALDALEGSSRFNHASGDLTLIAPERLGHSPPSVLLKKGVTFAVARPPGRVFCISSSDPRVHSC